MSRRFRPTDAFVDESIRGKRYLMGCVLIEARHLASLRVEVEGLVLTGGRVHFHNESPGRRREILEQFAEYPMSAFVVVCHRNHGVTEFRARELCLLAIVERLQHDAVPHLVLESRHDDREDERHLVRVRQAEPSLVFEHRRGSAEPMLWVADAIAWAHGAVASWRLLIEPVIDDVTELRP